MIEVFVEGLVCVGESFFENLLEILFLFSWNWVVVVVFDIYEWLLNVVVEDMVGV